MQQSDSMSSRFLLMTGEHHGYIKFSRNRADGPDGLTAMTLVDLTGSESQNFADAIYCNSKVPLIC
jgi:hypothetical protein